MPDKKYYEYKNRKEYLYSLSEKYNIDKKIIFMLAYTLGQDEDFDQLITEIKNYNTGEK